MNDNQEALSTIIYSLSYTSSSVQDLPLVGINKVLIHSSLKTLL